MPLFRIVIYSDGVGILDTSEEHDIDNLKFRSKVRGFLSDLDKGTEKSGGKNRVRDGKKKLEIVLAARLAGRGCDIPLILKEFKDYHDEELPRGSIGKYLIDLSEEENPFVIKKDRGIYQILDAKQIPDRIKALITH